MGCVGDMCVLNNNRMHEYWLDTDRREAVQHTEYVSVLAHLTEERETLAGTQSAARDNKGH